MTADVEADIERGAGGFVRELNGRPGGEASNGYARAAPRRHRLACLREARRHGRRVLLFGQICCRPVFAAQPAARAARLGQATTTPREESGFAVRRERHDRMSGSWRAMTIFGTGGRPADGPAGGRSTKPAARARVERSRTRSFTVTTAAGAVRATLYDDGSRSSIPPGCRPTRRGSRSVFARRELRGESIFLNAAYALSPRRRRARLLVRQRVHPRETARIVITAEHSARIPRWNRRRRRERARAGDGACREGPRPFVPRARGVGRRAHPLIR